MLEELTGEQEMMQLGERFFREDWDMRNKQKLDGKGEKMVAKYGSPQGRWLTLQWTNSRWFEELCDREQCGYLVFEEAWLGQLNSLLTKPSKLALVQTAKDGYVKSETICELPPDFMFNLGAQHCLWFNIIAGEKQD